MRRTFFLLFVCLFGVGITPSSGVDPSSRYAKILQELQALAPPYQDLGQAGVQIWDVFHREFGLSASKTARFIDWIPVEELDGLHAEVIEFLIELDSKCKRFKYNPATHSFPIEQELPPEGTRLNWPELLFNHKLQSLVQYAEMHRSVAYWHYGFMQTAFVHTDDFWQNKDVYRPYLKWSVVVASAIAALRWINPPDWIKNAAYGTAFFFALPYLDIFQRGFSKALLAVKLKQIQWNLTRKSNRLIEGARERNIYIEEETLADLEDTKRGLSGLYEILESLEEPSEPAGSMPDHRIRFEPSEKAILVNRAGGSITLKLPKDLIAKLPDPATQQEMEKALEQVLPKGLWLKFPDYDADRYFLFREEQNSGPFKTDAGPIELWRAPYTEHPVRLKSLQPASKDRAVTLGQIHEELAPAGRSGGMREFTSACAQWLQFLWKRGR